MKKAMKAAVLVLAVLTLAVSCDQGGSGGGSEGGNLEFPPQLWRTAWDDGNGASLVFFESEVSYAKGAAQRVYAMTGISEEQGGFTVYLNGGRQAAENYIRVQNNTIAEVKLTGFDCGGSWAKQQKEEGKADTVYVFFKMNNGTQDNYRVDYAKVGGKAARPDSDPQRQGYAFKGWYQEAQCAHTFDFDWEFKESGAVYIYAGWEQKAEVLAFSECFNNMNLKAAYYFLEGSEAWTKTGTEQPDETVYRLEIILGRTQWNTRCGDLGVTIYYGKNDRRRMNDLVRHIDPLLNYIWNFDPESRDFSGIGESFIFNFSERPGRFALETLPGGKSRIFAVDNPVSGGNAVMPGFCYWFQLINYYQWDGILEDHLDAEQRAEFISIVKANFLNQVIIEDFEWDAANARFAWIKIGEESAFPAGKYEIFSVFDQDIREYVPVEK